MHSVHLLARPVPRKPVDRWILTGVLGALLLWLLIFLAWPMVAILLRALFDSGGNWLGLSLINSIVLQPWFVQQTLRSLAVGVTTTLIVIPLAYGFAYALQRTCIPAKSLWRLLALMPLLAPSLLPGISLVYLFGNQGLFRPWMGDASIYGFWGIVIGEAFYTFPHALMVLTTSLMLADARLYDAAKAMGASPWRAFRIITFPSSRHGVFSAACLVFTLTVTDFGVAKVIGGDYTVLAIEAYKAVVGQMNFSKGAVIGLLLLTPALLTFALDHWLRHRRGSFISARAQPLQLRASRYRDTGFTVLVALVSGVIVSIIAVSVWASFIRFWPYNLSLSLRSYDFNNMDGGGWLAWRNSVQMSALAALFGSLIVFTGAWITETRQNACGRISGIMQKILHGLCLAPMAIPGMVLGLGYIFFFNHPDNPLGVLYGSMSILVICSIVHFYTSAHLTAVTAIRTIDPDLDYAAASLKVSAAETFIRVKLPICLPALLDIARYLFVSSMTTVSAVVFLYSPSTVLAAVAVLNMDDAGFIGPAAAMCCVIMLTSATAVTLLHWISRAAVRQTQRWRTQTHA
ncbi:putative 2-aminoethylphosphonate ABC transporter permease subunit [Orrella marina]|nr:putative 2-aminoethylphosphonate ABC transporter permease subunit [Orrella marina]